MFRPSLSLKKTDAPLGPVGASGVETIPGAVPSVLTE
jgi:hypothetical protein